MGVLLPCLAIWLCWTSCATSMTQRMGYQEIQLALQVRKIQTCVYPQPTSHSWVVRCVCVSRVWYFFHGSSTRSPNSLTKVYWPRNLRLKPLAPHSPKESSKRERKRVRVMYTQIMPSLPACLLLQFFNKTRHSPIIFGTWLINQHGLLRLRSQLQLHSFQRLCPAHSKRPQRGKESKLVPCHTERQSRHNFSKVKLPRITVSCVLAYSPPGDAQGLQHLPLCFCLMS